MPKIEAGPIGHAKVRATFDGSHMPELISVTSETVDTTFPELPRLVRLALDFGSKLQHGTLDVTLADGSPSASAAPGRAPPPP